MDLKKRVWEYSEKNPDGFTLNLLTFKPIIFGLVVGFKETLNCVGIEGLEKALDHASKNDHKIGGWLNLEDGNYYFDSVRIFFNKDEAIEFAKANNQIAIYDLTNLKEIRIK